MVHLFGKKHTKCHNTHCKGLSFSNISAHSEFQFRSIAFVFQTDPALIVNNTVFQCIYFYVVCSPVTHKSRFNPWDGQPLNDCIWGTHKNIQNHKYILYIIYIMAHHILLTVMKYFLIGFYWYELFVHTKCGLHHYPSLMVWGWGMLQNESSGPAYPMKIVYTTYLFNVDTGDGNYHCYMLKKTYPKGGISTRPGKLDLWNTGRIFPCKTCSYMLPPNFATLFFLDHKWSIKWSITKL